MGRAWILLYHHVAPDPVNPFYVTPAQLGEHVRSIRALGYTIGDLRAVLRGDDDTVVLTFDDAYGNVFEYALPVLADHGVTATVFVPINLVGGMNTHDSLVRLAAWRAERIMSWTQLGELRAMGWSIQSHGCSHLPLGSLLPEHVEDELVRSKRAIEDRLGQEVFAYAYAYGQPPDRSRLADPDGLLTASGYAMALLASGGATPAPPSLVAEVPRVLVTGGRVPLPPAGDVAPAGAVGPEPARRTDEAHGEKGVAWRGSC